LGKTKRKKKGGISKKMIAIDIEGALAIGALLSWAFFLAVVFSYKLGQRKWA